MLQNLSSAAVVIGALRVNRLTRPDAKNQYHIPFESISFIWRIAILFYEVSK